ncbi:hypothetical protein [Nocardioides pelophilus]|uniref:hypothetical protein n=1 Tax=Nocardioides pelophilus TaxID=2172019 RepID=UPI0016029C48|nr:hypothetical protein [Nocardioides pelophilus]
MALRPTLAQQAATLAFAALVAAGLSGCSDDPVEEHDSDQSVVISLKVESEWWPAAIVKGRMIEQDGCLLIDKAIAVFPMGTTWDAPNVLFDDGRSVKVGSRVRMGGGWAEVNELTQEGLPAVPADEVHECARRTGATLYVWARPIVD